MSTIRFGLAGYGGIGRLHAAAVRDSPDADLAAVCTSSPASAERAASDVGVATGTDFRALVDDPDIDAVIIATPSNLHAPMAQAALAAGKHLLLEKPMALTLAESDAIRAEARSRGLVLYVNHELRYSPLWRGMADAVESGRIGDPLSAAITLWRSPYRQGNDGWRYDPDRVGNWIYEEPIHFFDILRWLLRGDPERVTSAGVSAADHGPAMISSFASIVDFGAGRFGTLHQTLTGYGHQIACDLLGSEGALRARWSGASDRSEQPQVDLIHWDGGSRRPIDVPATPGESYEIAVQLEEFIADIVADRMPAESAGNGAWAVAVCDAATAALRTGTAAVIARPGEAEGPT